MADEILPYVHSYLAANRAKAAAIELAAGIKLEKALELAVQHLSDLIERKLAA